MPTVFFIDTHFKVVLHRAHNASRTEMKIVSSDSTHELHAVVKWFLLALWIHLEMDRMIKWTVLLSLMWCLNLLQSGWCTGVEYQACGSQHH